MITKDILVFWRGLGDKIAIETTDNLVTYAELAERVEEASNRIEESGFQCERPIGIAFHNSVEFVILMYGCSLLGIPTVLLGKSLKAREMKYHIQNCGIEKVLAAPRLDSIFEELECNFHSELLPNVKVWSFETDKTFDFNKNDFICQLTSGTNGIPKVAVRTIEAVSNEINETVLALNMSKEDVILTIPPIHHSYGLIGGTLAPLSCGAKVILRDTFMATNTIDDLVTKNISILFAVPFMYHLMNQAMKNMKSLNYNTSIIKELRSLRFCLSAGAPLTEEIEKEFKTYFEKNISIDYGSTEIGLMCLNINTDKFKLSVGKPLANSEVQIIDSNGAVLNTGEVGEVRIKSPSTARCYIYPKELNNEIFKEGWYYTRDIGMLDEHGYLNLRGRKTSIINVAGLKVDPYEVETVIQMLDGVRECVVIGVKSESSGQVVKAYIVPHDSIEKETIIKHCKKHLADFKVPRAIEFLSELPRSQTGKILRKEFEL